MVAVAVAGQAATPCLPAFNRATDFFGGDFFEAVLAEPDDVRQSKWPQHPLGERPISFFQ